MKWITVVALVLMFVVSTVFVAGCRVPYDVPEYKEVKNNETGFLIPLEGKTSEQAQLQSAIFLKSKQVAEKRVQIVHRWDQQGRWEFTGEWIPAFRLIVVDRSPVTREWTAEGATGTDVKNQAIWAESKDSIGFSTGISITAMIKEEDSATYLYYYPSSSLAQMLDTETRARVQMSMSDFSAGFEMSDLRGMKSEMMKAVRENIMKYYETRGITITTVAQFGGFCYENKKVQDSIDGVFIAQRLKEVAKAELEAQKDRNTKIESEATAQANARGMILKITKEAASDPVFLEMQRIEFGKEWLKVWDGHLPTILSGGDNSGLMMINLPLPQTVTKTQPVAPQAVIVPQTVAPKTK
jgi:hypothetical protein